MTFARTFRIFQLVMLAYYIHRKIVKYIHLYDRHDSYSI